MAINAYVNFSANCRQSIEVYSWGFQIKKPIIMTHAGAPPDHEYPMANRIVVL